MTQTLANRMTTDTDQVFVACNPLQPQEEMLESRHMAETHGGIIPLVIIAAAKAAAPYAATAAFSLAAGYILWELTSEPSGCNCNCNVEVNINFGG